MVVLLTTLQLCILVSRALGGYGVFGEDKIINMYFMKYSTTIFCLSTLALIKAIHAERLVPDSLFKMWTWWQHWFYG